MGNPLNPKARSNWSCVYTDMFGQEYDMGAIIQQLSIYESIYNDSMYGQIMLKENVGFAEKHNIIGAGNEKIHVKIESTIGDDVINLEKEFRVNSYSDASYSDTGDGTVLSVMRIVSPYLIKNNRTRINRSFNSMSSSEIVDYISRDILELGATLEIDWDELQTNETTLYTKNIVIPGWSPFKTLNWLASQSISVDGSSNYLWFENNTGFHFTSVDALKNQDAVRTLTVGIDISKSTNLSNSGLTIRHDLLEGFTNTKRFDHAESMVNGLYGGKIFTHNILTKSYNNYEVEYDSDEVILAFAGLNGASQFKSVPKSHQGFMPDEYLYNIHDKGEKSHYPLRDMKMKELNTNIVSFDMAGDVNIWAGDVVEINIPTTIKNNKNSDNEENLSGLWLVTAIHHKINNMEYVMTVECMKDGFEVMPEGSAL